MDKVVGRKGERESLKALLDFSFFWYMDVCVYARMMEGMM
jgi:hypothetical protein